MFNLKRAGLLLIILISGMITIGNFVVFLQAAKDIISSPSLYIIVIAWPLILAWFIFAGAFTYILYAAVKKLKSLNRQAAVGGSVPVQNSANLPMK